MRSFLICIGFFLSFNCQSQTPKDLFKELTDATEKLRIFKFESLRLDYDGITKANFELAFEEISDKLKGRWVADSDLNCKKNNLTGTNFIKGSDGSFKSSNFDKDEKLESDTIYKKVEKFKYNNETYFKLTGTRWFADENREYDYELIIIFGENLFSVSHMKINKDFNIKEGYFTQKYSKVPNYYKCQNNISVASSDNILQNNKKENFGVKGLYLGLPLPAEYQRLSGTNCKFEFNKTNESVGLCYFITTILNLEYIAKVALVNNKIFAVDFIDLITKSENEGNTNIKIENGSFEYYSSTPPNLRPLQKIKDFSMYANDVITNIIDATGDTQNIPVVSKNSYDHSEFNQEFYAPPSLVLISSWEVGLTVDGPQLNENQKRVLYNKLSGYSDKLLTICKNFCKLREMRFIWNLNSYNIKYEIVYPDSNTMPYPLYSSRLTYASEILRNEAKRVIESIQMEKKEKLERNTNLSKDRINEIERQKNELRKKDF